MRKFIIISLCIFHLSCHKNDSTPTYSSSFSFKANSTKYAWDFNNTGSAEIGYGMVIRRTAIANIPGGYLIQGAHQPENVNAYFFAETDSLVPGTYKWPLPTSVQICQSGYVLNGVNYSVISPGDSVVLTISSVSGKRYSGTFNAVMHDVNTQTMKMEITEGHFNNLMIVN